VTTARRLARVVLGCAAALMVSCASSPPAYPPPGPQPYSYGSPYVYGPPNNYPQGYGNYAYPPPNPYPYPPPHAATPPPQAPFANAPPSPAPAFAPAPAGSVARSEPSESTEIDRWVEILVVRWSSGGAPIPVSHGAVLHSGDSIAFYVRAQRPAFVGLCYVDPTGAVKNLIGADARRQLDGGETLRIPADASQYFPLEGTAGTERAIVVASAQPLDHPAFASLVDRARALEPTTAPRARRRAGALQGSLSRGLGDASAPENPYLELDGGREAIAVLRIEHRP
jgi:hypothetical protein